MSEINGADMAWDLKTVGLISLMPSGVVLLKASFPWAKGMAKERRLS